MARDADLENGPSVSAPRKGIIERLSVCGQTSANSGTDMSISYGFSTRRLNVTPARLPA